MNDRMRTMGRRGVTVVFVVVLSGCTNSINSSSKIEQGPVGIGRSINELKGTPCACTEIPMKIPDSQKV